MWGANAKSLEKYKNKWIRTKWDKSRKRNRSEVCSKCEAAAHSASRLTDTPPDSLEEYGKKYKRQSYILDRGEWCIYLSL